MAKPQIRHLAIMTLDPEKLAKFYEQVFEMERSRGPARVEARLSI
jgi:predicted enzyme related to lactoylglutathione lyase